MVDINHASVKDVTEPTNEQLFGGAVWYKIWQADDSIMEETFEAAAFAEELAGKAKALAGEMGVDATKALEAIEIVGSIGDEYGVENVKDVLRRADDVLESGYGFLKCETFGGAKEMYGETAKKLD